MEFEDLKPRNRTAMAVVACVGGFLGAHNFFLANSVSGSIKIYLTLVALIAPLHVRICMVIVNLAWILFDLCQICFAKTLPEIRFEGSRKKAALFVVAYVLLVAALAMYVLQGFEF